MLVMRLTDERGLLRHVKECQISRSQTMLSVFADIESSMTQNSTTRKVVPIVPEDMGL